MVVVNDEIKKLFADQVCSLLGSISRNIERVRHELMVEVEFHNDKLPANCLTYKVEFKGIIYTIRISGYNIIMKNSNQEWSRQLDGTTDVTSFFTGIIKQIKDDNS